MSLSRKMLKAMGIEEDKIEQIIEAHAETVDALKEDVKTYKADAETLKTVQKELDDLKAKGDDGYEEKYNALKKEYDGYKTDVEKKQTHAEKESAYRELLKGAGVKEKYIDTICRAEQSVIDELKLKDGKIDDAEKVTEAAKNSWSDFIGKTTTQTAKIDNPPANSGGGTKSKDEILAMKDPAQRQAEIAKNPSLFGLNFNHE